MDSSAVGSDLSLSKHFLEEVNFKISLKVEDMFQKVLDKIHDRMDRLELTSSSMQFDQAEALQRRVTSLEAQMQSAYNASLESGRECDPRERSLPETPKYEEEQMTELDKHVRSLQKDLVLQTRKLEAVEFDLQKLEKVDDVNILSQMQETVHRLEERMQSLERDLACAAEKLRTTPKVAPMSAVLAVNDREEKLEEAEEHLASVVEAHDQKLEVEQQENATAKDQRLPEEHGDQDPMQEGVSVDQLVSRASLQAQQNYQLQCSIWDVCMLINFPALGWFVDLHLLFGVLLNMFCQFFFCLIVQANMTDEVVNKSTVEAAKHWRSSIGHSVENVNDISGTSLVARLCAQDPATSASNAQLTMYANFVNFIEPTNEFFESVVFLNGRYLCIFSLLLWYLTVAHDIQANLKLAGALFSLPRGAPQLTITDDSGIKIRSISAWQCMLMMLLSIIPRMAMAIFLGISGTLFLCYTSSMEDLLLNAIALDFVLNIDEIIFESVAPHRLKVLIERLVPIEMELLVKRQGKDQQNSRRRFFAVLDDLRNVIRLLLICILLVVVDQSYLVPYQQNMKDVTKWLCHGRKDFAYAINKASGVVHFAETEPWSDTYPTEYAKESVLDITGLLPTKSSSTPWYANYQDIAYHHQDLQTVRHIDAFDVEFSAQWPSCFDVFDRRAVATSVQAQQWALRSFLGNASLMSCHDINISLCHDSDMDFLRGSCPDHCGCDKPWSGNFYGTVSNGCPRACGMWNQERLDLLDLPKDLQDMKPYLEECQDVPSEILSAKKEWQWWASAFYDSIVDLDPQYFETLAYPKTIAIEMGCRFFRDAMELGSTPCNPETSPGRSGRFWCPSTCNCAAGMSECPGKISTCQCQMGSCSRLYSKRTGDGTMNCSSVRLQDSTCPAGVAA